MHKDAVFFVTMMMKKMNIDEGRTWVRPNMHGWKLSQDEIAKFCFLTHHLLHGFRFFLYNGSCTKAVVEETNCAPNSITQC